MIRTNLWFSCYILLDFILQYYYYPHPSHAEVSPQCWGYGSCAPRYAGHAFSPALMSAQAQLIVFSKFCRA